MNYSPEFSKLIIDQTKFAKIMQDNCSSGDFEEWETKRKFISEVINTNGSILDIGCAGGFFLRSLQEWSKFSLNPYGIDINDKYINVAKSLFYSVKDHFAVLDAKYINNLKQASLPDRYTFVYWNVPSHWELTNKETIETVKRVISHAENRVIFGFYGVNKNKATEYERVEEKQLLEQRANDFEQLLPKVSGKILNPHNLNHIVLWLDKD